MVDAVGVAVENFEIDFDVHADLEIGTHHAFGYLAEEYYALGG